MVACHLNSRPSNLTSSLRSNLRSHPFRRWMRIWGFTWAWKRAHVIALCPLATWRVVSRASLFLLPWCTSVVERRRKWWRGNDSNDSLSSLSCLVMEWGERERERERKSLFLPFLLRSARNSFDFFASVFHVLLLNPNSLLTPPLLPSLFFVQSCSTVFSASAFLVFLFSLGNFPYRFKCCMFHVCSNSYSYYYYFLFSSSRGLCLLYNLCFF